MCKPGSKAAQCLLVIIGAKPEGKNEAAGCIYGVERAIRWDESSCKLMSGFDPAPELRSRGASASMN